jgi:1-acyl-sn-glycerol-3-phosphate acyltransferase
MRKIALKIVELFGWKIDKTIPLNVNKCVVIMGPHTSNWDYILGKSAFSHYGIESRFLIKKELFRFPLGWLLKRLGGIPVDRTKSNNLTQSAVEIFNSHENMYMVFSPEGTRKYSPNWKRGFYHIAVAAKVPIYLCYADYERKIAGFHSLFVPTGDLDADIRAIKKIYSQYKGKYPEQGIREE